MKLSIRRINEWLVVIAIVIVLPMSFMFVQDDLNLLPNDFHYLFNTHPTTNILAMNALDAIDIFGGKEPQGYSMNWKTVSMYFNVALFLMVGPFLFFKGYKNAKNNQNRSKPWYWYIGAAVCIGAVSIIPTEIIHIKVFENTKTSADKNRAGDLMRAELVEVGFATAQYEILNDDASDSFNMEDLNLNDLVHEYTIEDVQSDSLMIISVSNPEFPELGHTLEVRPYSQSVLNIRN